eukprot:1704556-Amphidinium_carterae.1
MHDDGGWRDAYPDGSAAWYSEYLRFAAPCLHENHGCNRKTAIPTPSVQRLTLLRYQSPQTTAGLGGAH